MQSLPDTPLTAQVTPGLLPRFQDGTINMQELIRQLAESIANEVMSAEADEFCGEGNSRNGYRERSLQTCVGTLTLKVPKLRRGSFFPEDVLTRYQRVDRALAAAVAEMYATGTSTRKVQRVAEKMGVGRLSKDQVSAIARDLDADVSELLSRDLSGCRTPYLWLDATYVKCRRDGRVASTAVVTAIGCDEHGWRRVLGLSVVDTESYDSWLAFLRGVRARGVDGVVLVTSDAHEGLRRAIAEVFQGASWQRCAVHLMRDCVREAKTRQLRRRVARIVAPVFRAKDADRLRRKSWCKRESILTAASAAVALESEIATSQALGKGDDRNAELTRHAPHGAGDAGASAQVPGWHDQHAGADTPAGGVHSK